jgi:GntR family transcriptional repressor for pyruvate dehydrogenase complex
VVATQRTMGPANSVPGHVKVVEIIQREIALGRILPGEKLPAERKFAEQLGVSRETVRQALRTLEGSGVLSIKRGASGGAFVCEVEMSQAEVKSILRNQLAEVLQLIDFREILEGAAAKALATSHSPEIIDDIDSAITQLENATTLSESRSADTAFHLAIARGTKNSFLLKSIEDARVRMFQPVDAFHVEFVKKSSLKAHRDIRHAIAHGDAAQAEHLMKSHLNQTSIEFKKLIDE